MTFKRPFILTGLDSVQPAGTYTIDVDEEEIENISFLAYKRASTQIQLPSLGRTEYHPIDPVELDEALLRDAAQKEPAVPQSAKRGVARRMLVSRFAKRR